jgi:hypothetical protein
VNRAALGLVLAACIAMPLETDTEPEALDRQALERHQARVVEEALARVRTHGLVVPPECLLERRWLDPEWARTWCP